MIPNSLQEIKKNKVGMGCAYLAKEITYTSTNRLVWAAIDNGVNHFDVAPSYGRGTGEKTLGKALLGIRDRVTIASKVGIEAYPDSNVKLALRALASPLRSYLRSRKIKELNRDKITRTKTNFSLKFVDKSLKNSLNDLRIDTLDVLFLHMVQLDDIRDELLAYIEKVKKDGLVLNVGLATSKTDINNIVDKYPGFFDVHQHSWDLADGVVKGSTFSITHGIISNSFSEIISEQEKHKVFYSDLSESLDVDLFDYEVLANLLIGAGVAMNNNGMILLASRNKDRLINNIRAAFDCENVSKGEMLYKALLEKSTL